MVGEFRSAEPWSGHFSSGQTNLPAAHINQFAQNGWVMSENGSGALHRPNPNDEWHGARRSAGAGSPLIFDSRDFYATMFRYDPQNVPQGHENDFTILLETFTALTSRTLEIEVPEGFGGRTLHVWGSDINGPTRFRNIASRPSVNENGRYVFRINIHPGWVYNITTTTGQGWTFDWSQVPASQPLELPFTPDFSVYNTPQNRISTPRFFVDIEGQWQIVERNGENVLRQMAFNAPTRWYGGGSDSLPYTVFGCPSWTDYEASVDVLFEGDTEGVGVASLAVRFGEPYMQSRLSRRGYYVNLHQQTGNITITRMVLNQTAGSNTGRNQETVLATFNGAGAIPADQWNNIRIRVVGNTITAWLNDGTPITATCDMFSSGNLALLYRREAYNPNTDNKPMNATHDLNFRGVNFRNIRVVEAN